MGKEEYVLQMNNISKRFGGVQALKGVSLRLKKQQVMGLVGENGAGKSTLIKVLMGINKMDEGEIIYNGQKVTISSPSDAAHNGICAVFQDLSLVNSLSVAENVYLSKELKSKGLMNKKAMYAEVQKILDDYKIPLHPDTLVETLSPAQKQLTEIVKSISFDPKILILDEPTSALTQREAEILYHIIDIVKKRGASIIYISHRMNEVIELCDSITVLRDGKPAGFLENEDITFDNILKAMVGREMDLTSEKRQIDFSKAKVALSVKGLTNKYFNNVSFEVKKGEILGIAGLAGAGRTELVQSIFGIFPKTEGTVLINGEQLARLSPFESKTMGLGMVPEQRLVQGLVMSHTIEDNIVSPIIEKFSRYGFVQRSKTAVEADGRIKELNVKAENRHQIVSYLSGGNAQKVVLGKWLATQPKVLILDEPTAGIDVQSKFEIREKVQKLAEEGMACIFISSELPELLDIADRIMVMDDFRIIAEVPNTTTQEEILNLILQDKMKKSVMTKESAG